MYRDVVVIDFWINMCNGCVHVTFIGDSPLNPFVFVDDGRRRFVFPLVRVLTFGKERGTVTHASVWYGTVKHVVFNDFQNSKLMFFSPNWRAKKRLSHGAGDRDERFQIRAGICAIYDGMRITTITIIFSRYYLSRFGCRDATRKNFKIFFFFGGREAGLFRMHRESSGCVTRPSSENRWPSVERNTRPSEYRPVQGHLGYLSFLFKWDRPRRMTTTVAGFMRREGGPNAFVGNVFETVLGKTSVQSSSRSRRYRSLRQTIHPVHHVRRSWPNTCAADMSFLAVTDSVCSLFFVFERNRRKKKPTDIAFARRFSFETSRLFYWKFRPRLVALETFFPVFDGPLYVLYARAKSPMFPQRNNTTDFWQFHVIIAAQAALRKL